MEWKIRTVRPSETKQEIVLVVSTETHRQHIRSWVVFSDLPLCVWVGTAVSPPWAQQEGDGGGTGLLGILLAEAGEGGATRKVSGCCFCSNFLLNCFCFKPCT